MDTLTVLFGNPAKVKVLRLFLFNETTPFLVREIVSRTKCTPAAVKKELGLLARADILKRRHVSKETQVMQRKKLVEKKLQGPGYILNAKFPYLEPLKNLLTITSLQADESLAKRFTNAGRIKLFVAAGVFIQNWDSRVDLLVVGDELNLSKIEGVITVLESEIGKEIAYSAFETQDFEYRYGIHDRLVRDILDYPHITLLDRLGIEPQQ
ncbi:MAG: hypothetical protein QOG91_458 [Candidatus Parcubacteria bacterium]|jgi:hypothetical protein|nr:hypothetical protein [Candidatus Parcubacteria bacterium]